MADLTITAGDVALVKAFETLTGPTAEAIDAGEIVRIDTSTGKFTLANASSAAEGRIVGVAVNSGAAGETITVLKRGFLDVGDTLASETIDEMLFASNTDGKIDDGAGAPTVDYNVGRVWPAWGATTADLLLFVDVTL
jgi:hypothetical protein